MNFIEKPAESPVDNQAGRPARNASHNDAGEEHKYLKFWEEIGLSGKLGNKILLNKSRS